MKNLKKQIVPLSILVLSTFLFNCQTSVQNVTKVEKEKNIVSINKDKKIFSIKNTGPILFLPFNGDCNDCGISTLSFSDGSTTSMGALGSISIGADGSATMAVGSRGGDLYSGPSSGVFANLTVSNPFHSAGGAIDTNGKPCISGGSSFHVDSSSPIDQTWYYKSGSINLSLQGYDLVGTVTGISSGNETALLAPWDGSCRPGETHPKYITNGTMNVRLKDVAFDPIALNVSKKLISLNPENDSDLTSTDISVVASNKGTWDLSIGNKNIDSGTTNDKTITIDKDHTYGLSDGDYTDKVLLNATSGPQSVKDTLQIDSTNPEIEDIEILDDSDPIKLEIKVKDPEVNSFKSGIDPNSISLEGIPGTITSFNGEDIVTCVFPLNLKLNELSKSMNLGALTFKISDKAKNKLETQIGSINPETNIEEEPNNSYNSSTNFSIKGIMNGKTSALNKVVFLGDSSCKSNYKLTSRLNFDDLPIKPSSVLKSGSVTYKISRLGKLNQEVYRKKFFFIIPSNEVIKLGLRTVRHLVDWDGKSTSGSFTDFISQVNGQFLVGGLYKLEVIQSQAHFTKGEMFIYKRGDSNSSMQKPTITDENTSYFRVINGNRGNGNYSSLDGLYSFPNKKNDFQKDQKDLIYEENKRLYRSEIDAFVEKYNSTKPIFPLDQRISLQAKERLVVDDVTHRILKTSNKGIFDLLPPDLERAPDIYHPTDYLSTNGGLGFANVDHIIPKNTESLNKKTPSGSCCKNGTNRFENAQVIDARINIDAKNARCGFVYKGWIY